MDNDKFVVFQSATVAEFEVVEAIRRLEDALEANRKAYIEMYVMLQSQDIVTDRELDALTNANELVTMALTKALAQMRERLAHAKHVTNSRWSDYIYS